MSNKRVDESGTPLSPKTQYDDCIETGTPVSNVSMAPFALVIDDEEDICQLVATTLGKLGVESKTFSAAKPAVASLDQRWPAIIFLDVALEQSDAIDVIRGLSEKRYSGTLQLMSRQRPWLLDAVQRIAKRHFLTLRPPLQKPIQGDTIREVIASVGLTSTATLQPRCLVRRIDR
jgi:DNA-binding NtrC family response regulator